MNFQQSEQINELATALAAAQAKMEGAKKDAQNPFFKSQYADLESVWTACRAPLTAHGLSVVQGVSSREDGMVIVTTQLIHKSGQWIRDSLAVKPNKADVQGVGSAITYARRYALAALVGVYQTDDDGEHAVNRSNEHYHNPMAHTPVAPRHEPAHKTESPKPESADHAEIKKWIKRVEEVRTLEDMAEFKKKLKPHWKDLSDNVKQAVTDAVKAKGYPSDNGSKAEQFMKEVEASKMSDEMAVF